MKNIRSNKFALTACCMLAVAYCSAQGSRIWATYYGGTGTEYAFGANRACIATDASGNVYFAGATQSPAGIASGGFQNTILTLIDFASIVF